MVNHEKKTLVNDQYNNWWL